MRTVSGPTDRVVVVGAGLAGLSAALRLAGAGREVVVLEREDLPGGRAGRLDRDGYRFDTGPTVLTMPGLVADALDCVGEDLDDWLDLLPLTPAYRARFADGSSLDVHTDPDAMAGAITELCGPAESDGYRRMVRWLHRLYRYEMRDFIDRNVDSPLGLLTPNLARLVAAGGFGRLAPRVGRYLRDDRTRRVFTFQAMYAGRSPYDALALYAVISYMDTVAGVYFPRGGMHALPAALAGAATKHGVDIRYGTEVARVERAGGRAVAVHTAAGERIACDALVLTPDLPTAWHTLLGGGPRRLSRLGYSPSCVLLLAGSTATYPDRAHHEITFGTAWRETFREVISDGRTMSDPSFLVTTPSASDPTLAPPDRSSYYVLFPSPNLTGRQDWSVRRDAYVEQMIGTLESRGYPGFGAGIEVRDVTTPADWAARGMAAGTPFAAAHSFSQTGPFRPRNLARGWDNVVFAGSGTVPGVGVPCVLISGRLAAERITGPQREYRSRAWP
ncbi:phytoene desaturase family protein [Sporichthya brevicatena]|uniref:Phytoene desaturase family protein n=1 Tax=Sporichthya brevicatena TaxID=171442 RepID=A0ABN1H0K5_9ACTN